MSMVSGDSNSVKDDEVILVMLDASKQFRRIKRQCGTVSVDVSLCLSAGVSLYDGTANRI